jgi:hypothetical protein
MAWWDKRLNVGADYWEVWCVPPPPMLYIKVRIKFSAPVYVNLFFEIPLYNLRFL